MRRNSFAAAPGKNATSSPHPTAALIAEPTSVPILPASSSGPDSASPATNSDIVKPMPPRQPAPAIAFQLTPAGSRASPAVTASQLNSTMPTGLPTTSPAATAAATGSPAASGRIGTAAFASAKAGMMANPTHGCSPPSRRASGDSAS